MNKLTNLVWVLSICVHLPYVHGQAPFASFLLEKNVFCGNELVALDNTSTNYAVSAWDFCSGDFHEVPILNDLSGLSVGALTGYNFIFNEGAWYSVVMDRNTHSLRILNFQNKLSNPPVINDLGNPGSALTRPEGLALHKNFNGYWVAFIGHQTINYGIVRAVFEPNLEAIATTENIGLIGGASRTRGVGVVEDGGSYYLLTTGYNINKFAVASLGNSLQNDIPDSDKHEFGAYAELNLPTGITAIKANNDWLVYVVSQGNGNLTRFNFGNSLTNTPILEANYSLGLINGKKIKIMRDGAKFYALIGSDSDPMTIWYMDDLNPAFTPQKINQPDLPVAFAFDVADIASTKYLQTVSSGQVQNYIYDKDCSSSLKYSEKVSPAVSYSQASTYPITLTVTDENGNSSSTTKEITVTSTIAPTIDFTAVDNCVTSPIQFTATSDQNITSWQWDFGDTQTAIGQGVTHQYAAPGTYNVRLSVDAENGCGNFIDKEVIIYPEPAPSFSELKGTICTNKTYFFQNTTPGDYGISYEWFVNGISVSTENDLTYRFQTSGAKEIKLVATIPGCQVEAVQNIAEVYEGAFPAFSVQDNCIGTIFQFMNTSTGNITSTHWDFGNGFTSSLQNPSFQYTEPGIYTVTLTLTNAAGCETHVTHSVKVFECPVVRFTNELACEGLPTIFSDNSGVGDANIVAWHWNFGDPNSVQNTSEEKDPAHVFTTSGVFDVQLMVESTNGCKDSLHQEIQVLASPVADFTFDKFCINEMIQFEDLSKPVPGENITSWSWDLNGEFSAEINPQVTFNSTGEHQVGLTVGSENRCTSTLYKTIEVQTVPEVSFGVEDACDNAEAHFFDTTVGSIAARTWNFAGQGSSVDSSVYHRFEEPGSYQVNLIVTTDNGCNYGVSQDVQIHKSPTAAFKPSMFYGAPPLEVNFLNLSAGGGFYSWNFDDGQTTTEKDPSHVFTKKEAYNVKLVVTDPNDCKDTTFRQINILDPLMELELRQIFVTTNTSGTTLLLTLNNNGSVIIDSVLVNLALGSDVITNEVLRKTILPGEQVNHVLSISFTNKNLKYLCVSANAMIEGLEDELPGNNTKCLGFENPIIIQSPYPNPGGDELNLKIVSEEQTTASIRLFDVRGTMVKEFQYAALAAGLNELKMSLVDVQKGTYVLKASCGGTERTFRIIIKE